MKELVAGVVLILVVGIAGFFYRNILEQPARQPLVTACTEEARVCPSGQSVGREGPSCAFAPCPPPNVEFANVGVALVPPSGYIANPNALGPDTTLIAVFEKPSLSENISHALIVRALPIPEGKTAESVIIENSMKEPSGALPESIDEFTSRIAGNTTFRFIVIERFEGIVHSAYYVVHKNMVLKFEVLERDVTNWTDPNLVVESLREHQALLEMLSTLSLY